MDDSGRKKVDCRQPLSFALIFLTVLGTGSIPATAAKRMNADQLQQILTASQSAHRKDTEVVVQLADVELAARVSPEKLKQLLATSPGPKTTAELRAIADASVFLDPPAGEIPPIPTPDIATQKAIIGKTVHYVARTLPTLPDFVAERVTQHFDDLPQLLDPGGWPTRAGLHLDGSSQMPIAYHDGRETDDPSLAEDKLASPRKVEPNATAQVRSTSVAGLTSWGEFGPILGLVLVDAAKGKLGWGHWEQIDGKPSAVFHFEVDRTISHYNVRYCCVKSQEVVDSSYAKGGNGRGGGQQDPSKGMLKSGSSEFHQITGYRGNLTVDPDTGTVLRIAIEADLKTSDPIQRAAMMVEYGVVKIGENIYTCPTRSISESLSHELYQPSPTSPFVDMAELQVNDVSFVEYHRFGSESTVISAALPASNASIKSSANTPKTLASATPTDAAAPAPESVSTAAVAPPADASAPPAATAHPSPQPSAPVIEPEQEILVRAAADLPGMEADSTAPTNPAPDGNRTSFTLRVTTRVVDLSLVATDKHGKPITDLKQDEIEVYDNGRKQQLVAFHHALASAKTQESQPTQSTQPTAQVSDTFTNSITVIPGRQDAPDLLILLMDESHLAFQDLNRARGEVLRFLQATRPDSRVALYSVSEHGFRVLQEVTQDHAAVIAKLTAWMPNAQAVSQAQALDRRIRQQFDTVHSASDLNSVNGNYIDAPDYITSADPELRQMGQNPLRSALEVMVALARHFASVPGYKSMAWISGDSVLADWEDQAVGMEKGSNPMEAAMLHTKEALNNAHIALYAVDASGIEGAAIDSSLQNRNVQLNQAAQENIASGGGAGRTNNGGAGRTQAEMQQDLHGIQGPVRQLAESTGGRAINKGGDLKALLDGIDQESAALYELGFDPDTPADGKFHTLQLKIPSRKDVKLRYRTGYLYTEEATSTRQRFQQAVWSPEDATAIPLTAQAVAAADSASGSPTIKLRIAFPGLALEQNSGHDSTRWTDQLYIFVAQRDDAAQKATVSGDTLRLSLKQASYESGMPAGIPYQHAVEVQSKLGTVRVIVVDGNSGKMGSVTLPSSAFHP